MTLKELADKLGVNRNVAARVAAQVPGARKEAAESGQIPRWVIPDDAIDRELITEEMVEAAREPANERPAPAPAGRATPPLDSALREEELAVQREELATKQVRAKTARLQAEVERRKAEDELKTLGGARPGSDPALAERLVRIEAALQRPPVDPLAALGALVEKAAPLVTPLLTKLVAPAAPTSPVAALTEALAVFEKIKGLAGSPEGDFRQEARALWREGMEFGREQAAAGGAAGADAATTTKAILDGIGPFMPDVLSTARELIAAWRGTAAPSSGSSERPAIPATGGPQPMQRPKEIEDLFTALIAEIEKIPHGAALNKDPVLGQIATALNVMRLLGQIEDISLSLPSLQPHLLRLIDPRLVSPALQTGVAELLAYVKVQVEKGGA